jgi:anti-sigma regulatory factor (Ser/Thr protein kinase)
MNTTTATSAIAGADCVPPPPLPLNLAKLDGHWPRRVGLELDAYPSAAHLARAHAREVLGGWGLLDVSDDIALIVSELMTNAIQSMRGGCGGDPVRLWLLANSTDVAILVWDPATDAPRLRDASPDDESGRGLMIVDALSAQWGWDLPSLPYGGKVVWALLELSHTERTSESPMQHNALFAFERTNLEKLRLACQVILDQAEEPFVSDSLEEELYGLRDQIDRVLLLPDRPAAVV